MITAERLMLLGGVCAFVLTVSWVRRRDLREKYAVGWLIVASFLLLCGLFPRAVEAAAQTTHLSYPSAVLFVSLAMIYLYSFSVSVSLTHSYRRGVRLTQEIAMLEQRVRDLEQRLRP